MHCYRWLKYGCSKFSEFSEWCACQQHRLLRLVSPKYGDNLQHPSSSSLPRRPPPPLTPSPPFITSSSPPYLPPSLHLLQRLFSFSPSPQSSHLSWSPSRPVHSLTLSPHLQSFFLYKKAVTCFGTNRQDTQHPSGFIVLAHTPLECTPSKHRTSQISKLCLRPSPILIS